MFFCIYDTRFAEMKAEYLLNVKKQSFAAIRGKLAYLGVDKDIIDSVLLNFGPEDQTEEIIHLLQTKYRTKMSQPEKVIASLIRKGFRYNEIKQAMDSQDIYLQEY